MRILVISRCPPYPMYLGDRLIVNHVARELSARGHTLDLLAFFDRDSDVGEIEHYRALFGDVQLIREPGRGMRTYMERLLVPGRLFPKRAEESWAPEMWRAIEARLAAQKYDVIHLFGGVHVYEFRALVESFPNVIVPYESYALFLERALRQSTNIVDQLKLRAQLEAARRFEQAMFEGYQRVVVLTDTDAKALRSLNPKLALDVIPNGIDVPYFTRSAAETDPSLRIIVFIGNYEYGPNVDAASWLATDIFPRIHRRVSNAQLNLVGNAPPPALQSFNGELVHVTGRVPDVRPYLEQAAVFVSPLRVGAGIKNKVLEAMSMGLPIVATRLSADGIGLREGENVLFGEDAEALANAAVRLLGDDQLRAAMGKNNRALIEERFTWARVADAYESLYSNLQR